MGQDTLPSETKLGHTLGAAVEGEHWERVSTIFNTAGRPMASTLRLQVPGGWLYRHTWCFVSAPDTMCFVPVPSMAPTMPAMMEPYREPVKGPGFGYPLPKG